MRGRFAVVTTALVLAAAALTAVVGGAASAVEESSGGVFVPIQPIRIVNATTWTGGSGNFTTAETRSYQVLGVAGVPASNVSAVVVDLAAHGTTAQTSSYLTAWASGESRPVVSSLYYTHDNVPRSNTAVVPVGTNGKISVFNYTGTTSVTVDLQGYFTKTSGEGSSGGFVALHDPVRVANTNTGQGVAQSTIPVGGSVDVQVTGVGDVEDDATSVFANVEVSSATTAGQMRVGPGGTTLTGAAGIDYGTDGRYDSGMSVKLSNDGRLRVTNAAGSPVNIKVDVQGYWSGDPSVGGTFTPLTPTNVYSTAASGEIQLQGKETRAVKIAGVGGLPAAGTLGSAFVTVNVKNWTAGGTVAVFSNDIAWPGTSNVGFDGGEGVPSNGISSTAVARVSSKGYVALYNTSPNPVSVTLTTQGWFSPSIRSVRPGDNEVAMTGTIAGATSLSSKMFIAKVSPRQDIMSGLSAGDAVDYFVLPEGSVRTSGNRFVVVIDPRILPASYVEDDGDVFLKVVYIDSQRDRIGVTARSVQVLDHSTTPAVALAGRTWIDPGAAVTPGAGSETPDVSELEEVESDRDAAEVTSTGEAAADASEVAVLEAEESDDDSTPDTPTSADPLAEAPLQVDVQNSPLSGARVAAGSVPRTSRVVTYGHKPILTIVGAVRPVGSSTAYMGFRHGRGQKTQVGVATSVSTQVGGGNFEETSSRWVNTSFETHTPASRKSREISLHMDYKQISDLDIDIYTGIWTTTESWVPTGPAGNILWRNLKKERPNWKNCVPVKPGAPLTYSTESGHDYTLSGGVKFAGVLGFNMDVRHSWNTTQYVTYNVGENAWMCGKDAAPAMASKVMMSTYNRGTYYPG